MLLFRREQILETKVYFLHPDVHSIYMYLEFGSATKSKQTKIRISCHNTIVFGRTLLETDERSKVTAWEIVMGLCALKISQTKSLFD